MTLTHDTVLVFVLVYFAVAAAVLLVVIRTAPK